MLGLLKEPGESRTPLVLSTYHGDQSYAPLITDFARALPGVAQTIRASAASGNLASTARLIRELRSRAGICGFDAIAASAEQVQAAIARGAPTEDAQHGLEALLRLCACVRAPAVPSASPAAATPPAGAPASPGAQASQSPAT